MKFKEIKKLSGKDLEKKMKELKMELVKSKTGVAKQGSSRTKEIRKIIARIHTFNNLKVVNNLNGVNNLKKGNDQTKSGVDQNK